MAYRSTKEKFAAHAKARDLYVKDGLSLKEVSQQTGATLRTLGTWRNLGDWKNLREEAAKTDLDRLESLRDSLLDKAEAQIKEGKLPHTEIGLMYRLEKLIVQRKKEEAMVKIIALNTITYFIEYLLKHDPKLAQAFAPHLEEFNKWIGDQDFAISWHHFLRLRKRDPVV